MVLIGENEKVLNCSPVVDDNAEIFCDPECGGILKWKPGSTKRSAGLWTCQCCRKTRRFGNLFLVFVALPVCLCSPDRPPTINSK